MRSLVQSAKERGDTIIEVIFAITIFSFVAISCMAIMNQGIATGERALEITLVRQQINAQAEALRYIHEARVVSPDSSYAATWGQFTSTYRQAGASPYGANGTQCVVPSGSSYHPFIVNARTGEIWSSTPTIEPVMSPNAPPFPQVVYNTDSSIAAAYGLWIESVPSGSVVAQPFVDFHIRACWQVPGTTVPMAIGTIVRLYDPR